MFTNFQYWGEWFLPEFPENKVTGIIKGDINDGIYLEIFGKLLPDEMRHHFFVTNERFCDLILGEIEKEIKITLYSNVILGTQLFSSKPIEKFFIKYFIQGGHFYNLDELIFDRFHTSYSGLFEFINQSGINVETKISETEKKFNLRFEQPPLIEIQLNPNLKGSFGVLPKYTEDIKKSIIEQEAYFEIEASEELKFETILDYSKRIQLLLGLTANWKVFPTEFNLWSDKTNSLFNLMYIPPFYDNRFENHLFLSFRFRLTEVMSDFPELCKNWFSKYEALKIAFDILEEAIYGQHTNDTRFLHLVRAIESYHRLTHSVPENKIESYSNKLGEIKMKLGGRDRTWMEKHNCINKYGYEPNLSKRIKDIIEETESKNIAALIKRLTKKWNKPSKFADEVVRKRNKMTHPKEKEDSIIKDGLLADTNKVLEFILIAHTYIEIGFDSEIVDNMFKSFLPKNIP